MIIKLFDHLYNDFEGRGYFQEAFGYYCVDALDVPGTVGDINAYLMLKLRKDCLWPIDDKCSAYTESDLFDVIELLYDHVSKSISGFYHSYGDCGMHYDTFDKKPGQGEYRTRVNELLRDYNEGYELSPEGEIVHTALAGTEPLINDESPTYDPQNVDHIVQEAISCYKLSRSSTTDKRNAVNMLAGVLEFLRPKIKTLQITADENDLFNIANNFGIRHHDKNQKIDYDQEIWLDWIFYHYLASVKAIVRLIKKGETST